MHCFSVKTFCVIKFQFLVRIFIVLDLRPWYQLNCRCSMGQRMLHFAIDMDSALATDSNSSAYITCLDGVLYKRKLTMNVLVSTGKEMLDTAKQL